MSKLYLYLAVGCFIALIVGFLKPGWVIRWGSDAHKNKVNVLKYYGIGFFVFFILFGSTVS